METVLTVKEAMPVLQKYFITDSEQVLTRWLRKKRLRGSSTSNRKEGWRISIEDLLAFIDQKRPGIREAFEQKRTVRR